MTRSNTDGNYDAFARIQWPVRTARLTLRPAEPGDADAVWGWRRLPEVSHWMTAAAGSVERFRDEFADRLSRTLLIEHEGRPIGDGMLRVVDAWAQAEVADQAEGVHAELGWALAPAAQGHGYATEAVLAIVGLCFGKLGIRRIEASCFAGNEPSWRMMERLGMRRELHAVAESLHRNGEWLDGYTYALLGTEWFDREHSLTTG